MTGRNYHWHRAWTRLPDGRLQHESGAIFAVSRGDGYTDAQAAPETLEAFQAFELARGVPLHDLVSRLQRLAREAEAWRPSDDR